MGRLSILSIGLFILPIAITIAILVGLETYRASTGRGPGIGSPFSPPDDNGINTTTYCQLSYGITPLPERYTMNPNQWGTTGASGLCMNVTAFNNASYATNITAPPFTATWQYPRGPVEEPVHAFPNAMLMLPDVIPVQLSNMSSLLVDVEWTYGGGETVSPFNDEVAIAKADMNANVCVDMFLDSEAASSGITNVSAYEVMVWLGRYGTATLPIGMLKGSVATVTVNTTDFDLYTGGNGIGQKVFTWVAQGNATDFTGDIEPLIQKLEEFDGPTKNDYLGYVAFGSEALLSLSEVTFSVPDLKMDIITG